MAAGGALAMTVPGAPAAKGPVQEPQAGRAPGGATSSQADISPEQGGIATVSTARQRRQAVREVRQAKPSGAPGAAHAASGAQRTAVIENRVPLILGVTY
jgi:hypothetical protein